MRFVPEIALAIGLYFVQPAFAGSIAFQAADQTHQALDEGSHAQKASDSLDGMIKTAENRLREAGYEDDADQMVAQYAGFRGFMLRPRVMTDVGDHDPIAWMHQLAQKLNDLLGPQIMKLSHLDDIDWLAYCIPVTHWCLDAVDAKEYSLHFCMEMGIIAYWTADLTCTFASYGTAYALICSPIGSMAEEIISRVVAPRFSDKFWAKACQ